ncbi:MAG: hypothetical protein ABW185_27210 [Sedimenticola sp.]
MSFRLLISVLIESCGERGAGCCVSIGDSSGDVRCLVTAGVEVLDATGSFIAIWDSNCFSYRLPASLRNVESLHSLLPGPVATIVDDVLFMFRKHLFPFTYSVYCTFPAALSFGDISFSSACINSVNRSFDVKSILILPFWAIT